MHVTFLSECLHAAAVPHELNASRFQMNPEAANRQKNGSRVSDVDQNHERWPGVHGSDWSRG